MGFTSFSFAIFLPIVFLLYWFVFNKTDKTQNALLLIASIVFYAMADWKFISLLAASGFVNFWLAKKIAQQEDESTGRRMLFYLGIVFNVGILLYFKYFNFFIESFVSLLNFTDAVSLSFTPLHILLPLGISFFTFQMIGYLIDVNNEEIEPTNDLLSFFTYLAYFPKILSGPIERIQNFLPQIQKKREFDYFMAVDGFRQILWGLFKKVVIADNLTVLTNIIFDDYQSMTGGTLLLGSIFYIVSLYADFSGFSDMACGVSKLFNIKIVNNFNFPFFTTNISAFWKRWHISLTSWMMDYVYTPLSFITRRHRKYGLIVSIIITFLLVGLWHGANWTFVVFGLLHGLYFIPIVIKGSVKNEIPALNRLLPSMKDFVKMSSLFLLVSVTSIFFRANNINQAFDYIRQMFTGLVSINAFEQTYSLISAELGLAVMAILAAFVVIEWLGRDKEFPIAYLGLKWRGPMKYAVYFVLIVVISALGGKEQEFIYFQF